MLRAHIFFSKGLQPWSEAVLLLVFFVFEPSEAFAGSTGFIDGYVPRPASTTTFARDIAPIIYQNCSVCHRAGQSGPFALLGYSDVRKHAHLIADVVAARFMPPWQPEAGFGEFVGERRLNIEQIGRIQQWLAEGSPEGNPADLPSPPALTEGWQLGQPDLILTNSGIYNLPAVGRDVYRNFVLTLPMPQTRYVRAMEFHAKNRAVHHASIRIDKTPESRLRDAKEPGPGFSGMDMPPTAETPEGHFLSWQPGRGPYLSGEGTSWTLPVGADLVVQLHLKPSGKVERIQPELGLYFTDQPPTKQLYKLVLGSKRIDIPAGERAYLVEDSFRLPVDVRVTGLNPHAHYLGKDLQGFAMLPDGSRKWLIWIRHWSFFWQGDYRLKSPMALPAGTVLTMRYTYDNSADNPENPSNPPKRVRYGTQTTDEMAELWVQVTGTPSALATLANTYASRVFQDIMAASESRLLIDANDAEAHTRLGSIQLASGDLAQALGHLCAATNADPSLDEPHYYLGLFFRQQNQLTAARKEFQKAVELNPDSYKAHGNLGFIAEQQGHWAEAEKHFRRVLEIYPLEPLSTAALEELMQARKARRLPGSN
jgi:hypothetical protein